jgi:DeoD family purine-nucleoside phosphorylase
MQGSLESPTVNDQEEPIAGHGLVPCPGAPGRAPIHLRPTAELAERVLLPGDPGRALALAQLLLEKPLMFNHHRGLWGYSGMAEDGQALTIQSTGMGGPSAAIVLHELIEMGVRRAIRVGTCGALSPELALGELVVAREAIVADGTSAALGGGELTRADPGLVDALVKVLGDTPTRPHRAGRIVSTDLFYERDRARSRGWVDAGAIAVEMEASTLFAVGVDAGVPVACLLAVSDVFDDAGKRIRIEDHALMQAAEAMGAAALAALGPSSEPASSSRP